MKFFQKSSTPLLLLGLGLLMLIFGLTSTYTLIEKSDVQLIESFSQRINLNQDKPETVYGTAGEKVNLYLVGEQSLEGKFALQKLEFSLKEATKTEELIFLDAFDYQGWDENLSASAKKSEILIPVFTVLPKDLSQNQELDGKVSGEYSYPLSQNNELIEEGQTFEKDFKLKVLSREELLKQIRKLPIISAAITIPLALILIFFGLRTEMYGKKQKEQNG
ncbi:MAG: hypothetical protein KBA03_00975 [Anaerolineaceae bacterium]|nr:hypothetical protein [Anaerolineaceae bacterium]